MVADFFRSSAVVETFLLLMLLAWLAVSAVMTLRAGQRDVQQSAPRQDGRARTTMSPAARATTGAPRS